MTPVVNPKIASPLEETMASPAGRNYMFLAGACATLNFVLMAGESLDVVAILSTMIAIAGLTLRWSISPFIYLLLVGYHLFDPGMSVLFQTFARFASRRTGLPRTEQLLIALGVIGYIFSMFRLMSFWHTAAPARFRNRKEFRQKGEGKLNRPFANAPEEESYGFAVQVLACAAFGLSAMMLLNLAGLRLSARNGAPLERHLATFSPFVAVTVGSLVLFHLICLLLESRQQSREKAYLILADTLWNETRREQQRIDRWTGWFEDRARERGENKP